MPPDRARSVRSPKCPISLIDNMVMVLATLLCYVLPPGYHVY